jgi:hypothetical protein
VGVTILEVRTRRQLAAFVAFPYTLYTHDPNWVAPLRRDMRLTFDLHRNPFHREAEIAHFLAVDERGRNVGRVAAIIHPAYIDLYGPTAFFGFFECGADEEAASSLLRTVEVWAAERGMSTVAGPYSYTSSQDVGFLVDGFTSPSALLQPYNPSYYPTLVEACGYKQTFGMDTYTFTRTEYAHRGDDVLARGAEVLARNGLTVRDGDLSNYDRDVESLRKLYNRSFREHPESLPIGRPVFQVQADALKAILDPSLVRIVEDRGKPVAFCLLVPNINEVMRGRSGRITVDLLLRWRHLLKSIRSVVIVMIGADPDLFGRGIGRVLMAEMAGAIRTGQYHTAYTTWIHEANWSSRALLKYLGACPTKRYAVFGKALA